MAQFRLIMQNRINIAVFFLTALAWTVISPDPAFATCDFGRPEGVHTHQLAHLLFVISMGILIYRMGAKTPHLSPGWRFFQYSALFFILWSLDAAVVHFLNVQCNIIQVKAVGPWHIKINDCFNNNLLKVFYYLARMDYLLFVPGFIFLFYGLKRILKENRIDLSETGTAGHDLSKEERV